MPLRVRNVTTIVSEVCLVCLFLLVEASGQVTNATVAPTNASTPTIPVGTPAPPTVSTPAPTPSNRLCEPSCRVNLFFGAEFLQTSNNVESLFEAVLSASGVGNVQRIDFNVLHEPLYGIPFGNGTLITCTISSFPATSCNNYTNALGCASLVNQSNPPTLSDALSRLGVTNGTLIPADAAIPKFGLLGSVSSLYLTLYVGSGIAYLLFLLWTSFKFIVAFQLASSERVRDEADRAGMTVEELEQKKKEEEEASKNKGKKRRRPPPKINPQRVVPQQQEITIPDDQFSTTDVDHHARHSLEDIVDRMRRRSSAQFIERQQQRDEMMQREMVPVVSKQLLDVVKALDLPPESNVYAIQRGGLVSVQDQLSSIQLPTAGSNSIGHQVPPANAEVNATFRRRSQQLNPPPDSSAPAEQETAFLAAVAPSQHQQHAIDALL